VHGDGAVVLLHTWPGPTADALPTVVERVSSAGARFVTVDELERLP
jgi:peptidoglycan/xylan/chitin deacetylase (PgdA/CDA1 family)